MLWRQEYFPQTVGGWSRGRVLFQSQWQPWYNNRIKANGKDKFWTSKEGQCSESYQATLGSCQSESVSFIFSLVLVAFGTWIMRLIDLAVCSFDSKDEFDSWLILSDSSGLYRHQKVMKKRKEANKTKRRSGWKSVVLNFRILDRLIFSQP